MYLNAMVDVVEENCDIFSFTIIKEMKSRNWFYKLIIASKR